jgi:hypothetical protein
MKKKYHDKKKNADVNVEQFWVDVFSSEETEKDGKPISKVIFIVL